MAGESLNKPEDDRSSNVLRTVDDLVENHITRLQRWLTTWSNVDLSHIQGVVETTNRSGDGYGTILTSIPVLDAVQIQAEARINSVIERVEHLVTVCNSSGG